MVRFDLWKSTQNFPKLKMNKPVFSSHFSVISYCLAPICVPFYLSRPNGVTALNTVVYVFPQAAKSFLWKSWDTRVKVSKCNSLAGGTRRGTGWDTWDVGTCWTRGTAGHLSRFCWHFIFQLPSVLADGEGQNKPGLKPKFAVRLKPGFLFANMTVG